MEYITRETGAYPISVGTSLALEGLLGQHPNQSRHPSGYKRINQLWVNLRTLVRNFFAAMTTDQVAQYSTDTGIDLLIDEVTTLSTVMEQQTNGQIKTVFYVVDLSETRWLFPSALTKEPTTEKQIKRHQLEHFTLMVLLQQLTEQGVTYHQIGKYPPAQSGCIALLTHYPHELLWRFHFDVLFLLESHTGKLKSYAQWKTKLKGVTEDDHIPFNAFTLQVFGDGTYFAPHPKKLRDEVKQLAVTRKWTGVTTLEKIRNDIRRYGGETLKQTFDALTRRL